MTTALTDQDGRSLITRTGLGSTLFVEAGAGTGKTKELVDRIVNLVTDAGVPLARIAAITFTEAAAAELQDRIRVALERAEASATEETIRSRCRAAIADTDLAALSTLHGFAKRILSEHPVAAGLPPRISVLDEVGSELAREDRWERFVDAFYDDPANEELLLRAASIGVALEPQYQGHATMKDVAAELDQSWDRLEAVAGAQHGPLEPVDFGPFDAAVEAIARVPDRCIDHDDRFYRHLTETLLPSMQQVAALTDPHRKLRALQDRDLKWGPGSGGKGPPWGGDVQAAKAHVAEVNGAREAVIAAVANDVLSRLLTAVSRHVLDAAETRRTEGQLEFHDLLVLARRLLHRSPAARHALHERYTHLLLDEFQDTDPLQIDIATLIAASVDIEPRRWQDASVAEGRLFFVGDPKQSIYRFRRADIELFLEARDTFGANGSRVVLRTNFRTVPEVLAWVNEVFARLMPEEVPKQQPAYEPLAAHRSGDPGADHRPVLLGHPHEKASAAELREAEAADVARTIDDVRHRPEAWPVYEPAEVRWRPATLADVTILVPTRTSLPFLRDALDARDIPYRLDTGTLVYDTQEVRDALAAVRAVDDPTDQLSVVAALRSPLYACADTELFEYRSAGGSWDLRRDPPADLAADHPVVAGMAHLRTLWRERWWMSPSALLDRLLRERQAFLLAFGDRRPKEVWRRLRFLVDQARSFEESAAGGLREFVAWAELQRAEGARVHEPLLPETDDRSVRILTVHGAKGLEFPITVLSGMSTRPAGRRSGVSLVWDDGVPGVRLRKNVATDNHDPRADIEAEMDVHEKLRLLYVGCTRARDHLVVACHHQAGDRSYANHVWDLAAGLPDTWRRLPEVPTPATADEPAGDPALVDDDRQAWLNRREALLAPQREARVVSATAIARAAGAADPLDDPDAADGADEERPLIARRRGRAGTAIGRAVHATLQVVDLASPGPIDQVAAQQAHIEAVPEHASLVAAMVRSALQSEAVQEARSATHHKELYVAAPVGGRVIEGYVDLLVESPGGLTVIDYKTDTVRSEAEIDDKLATYELQAAAYAVALEAATGMRVTSCRFVFCRPSGAIERAVPDLEAAKHRVRDFTA